MKWRNWIIGVAALITGSVTLEEAIQNSTCMPPMNQEQYWFYVAIQDDEISSIPEYFFSTGLTEYRILGERSGKVVTIKDACGQELRYRFDVSPVVNVGGTNWRLAKTLAPKYIARSWKTYADETSGVRFYKGDKDVAQECLNNLTGAQCRTLISAINPCFHRASDNQLCRYGFVSGTETVCTITAQHRVHPCEVTLGEVPEDRDWETWIDSTD